jgi:serine/threonine protein kinase
LAIHYFKQLISALKYLHSEKQIAHRDLKLENIVLDSNFDLKICDFGLASKYVSGQKLDELVGTDTYMSPQIIK